MSSNRDILVLLNTETITEQELQGLHRILQTIESPDHFCQAHELVDRNRITSKPRKIIRESRRYLLRPFRFLINKN